jgi:hypothetical protein
MADIHLKGKIDAASPQAHSPQTQSPPDRAEEEIQIAATVTNLAVAIARAQDFSQSRIAMTVANMAMAIAGSDGHAKSTLAVHLHSIIRELDEDFFNFDARFIN